MSDTRCRADSPIRCDNRAAAMARQDFVYVWGWGWVWWKAANPTRAWTDCPWCAGPLPPMEGLAAPPASSTALETYRQADGLTDGEGAE